LQTSQSYLAMLELLSLPCLAEKDKLAIIIYLDATHEGSPFP